MKKCELCRAEYTDIKAPLFLDEKPVIPIPLSEDCEKIKAQLIWTGDSQAVTCPCCGAKSRASVSSENTFWMSHYISVQTRYVRLDCRNCKNVYAFVWYPEACETDFVYGGKRA